MSQQNGPSTSKLQKAQVLIASQEYCENINSQEGLTIYSSHICAIAPVTETGACHGDSGGPLTVDGKLVGLVSWGVECGSTKYPTVSMETSVKQPQKLIRFFLSPSNDEEFTSTINILISRNHHEGIDDFLCFNSNCTSDSEDFYNERIVRGKIVKPGEIPYTVSIQNILKFNFCSGSILNKKYVLSAAHCFTKLHLGLSVVAGTTNLDHPYSTYIVIRIIKHENYDKKDSSRNDIALLKISSEFVESSVLKFVKLPLPHQKITPGSIGIVSGFGTEWIFGPASKLLLKARTFITSEKYCKNKYKRRKVIYKSQICAIITNVRTGPCKGDSGGPLTVRGRIVGITSWGNGCGSVYYPGVYTRVSEYLDWIKANTD
ncbi:hypothetical protein PV326_002881 [Microctonus aethiopoides]|nr:hypothetical protein PV326_002881 [Microctonus aethiopoides]